MKTLYRSLALLCFAAGLAACSDDAPATTSATDTAADTAADGSAQPDTGADTGSGSDTGSDTGSGSGAGPEAFVTCDTDADCGDGLDCTTDSCVADGSGQRICAWTLAERTCLIDGLCIRAGAANPTNDCEICDTTQPNVWAFRAAGFACDDGNACTQGDSCAEGGTCLGGEPLLCDDNQLCTVDACSPFRGCVYLPVPDGAEVACDDGAGCTSGDVCKRGRCEGAPVVCDDGNDCTDEVCLEGSGCAPSFNTAACDDSDPCTLETTCSEGRCGGGSPNSCNDFNQCTIDLCDADAGCVNLPTFNPCCTGAVSVCDDGDACTTDLCNPETTECSYETNAAPCDDGNACTVGDSCAAGACGGPARSCDDGNDCTTDDCNINIGCVQNALSGISCSDGFDCTTGDACVAGSCQPADSSLCVCTPNFDDVAKVNSLQLSDRAAGGPALDLNGDGRTDNALGGLAGLVNAPLADAVSGGSILLLLEFIQFGFGDFVTGLHNGTLTGDLTCDPQTQTCDYLAQRALVDPGSCLSIVQIPSNFDGALIRAGGPGTTIPFSLPLGGSVLDIQLFNVTAELTPILSAGEVIGFSGILAGAATEAQLSAAIRSVPASALPLPPETIISTLRSLAPNDIDTNGDGVLDAKSIALQIEAIDGRLVGAEAP